MLLKPTASFRENNEKGFRRHWWPQKVLPTKPPTNDRSPYEDSSGWSAHKALASEAAGGRQAVQWPAGVGRESVPDPNGVPHGLAARSSPANASRVERSCNRATSCHRGHSWLAPVQVSPAGWSRDTGAPASHFSAPRTDCHFSGAGDSG